MFEAYDGLVRVDVFTPSIEFSWEAERTRVRRRFGDQEVWVLSAESLSVFKMLSFVFKDLVELERLIATQRGKLDTGYVRRHLVEMVGEDDERVKKWDELVSTFG